jgi:hypothetical protein
MRGDGSEPQLRTPASMQRSGLWSTTKSKRQGGIVAPEAEAVMIDDDGPRLSPDDQQKLAAIGAALDREAGAMLGLDAGTKLTAGGEHRWLVPAAAGVGVVVLVLVGVLAWKAARGPLPPTPSARPSLPVDASASSGRSRIASRTEALPAAGTPLLDQTARVARSGSQTAPEIPTSTAPTVAPTTSVSAPMSETEKLEDRLTRLETETARLRGVVQELSERVRATKARVRDGQTTAQKVPAERGRQPESRRRAAHASVARADQ